MNRDDKLKALETEIRGIELELSLKRPLHRSLSIAIEALEREKDELIYRAYHLRKEGRNEKAQA